VQTGKDVENTVHTAPRARNPRRAPEIRATRPKPAPRVRKPAPRARKPAARGKKAPQPRNDKILRLMTKYCEKYYNYCGDI